MLSTVRMQAVSLCLHPTGNDCAYEDLNKIFYSVIHSNSNNFFGIKSEIPVICIAICSCRNCTGIHTSSGNRSYKRETESVPPMTVVLQ